MTIPSRPFVVRNGATLTPTLVNANLDQAQRDIQDNLDQRYTYSNFTLDWTGENTASLIGQELLYKMTPPFYLEIVGVELYIAVATTNTITLSASGSGLSGWEDVVATAAGSTTRVQEFGNFVASNTASSQITFTLSAASSATLAGCKAIIHIRTDRGNAGSAHTYYTPTRLVSGDELSASALNTEFTNLATSVTADGANDKQLRIQVLTGRNLSDVKTWRIPSSGRRLNSWQVGIVGEDNTCSSTWTYKDENAATVSSVTVTSPDSSGNLTLASGSTTNLPDTQTLDAPQTTASDYKLSVDPDGGNHGLDYAVLYWT